MKMDSRDIEKVYQLLESGQKVIAIKEIREMTGLGLVEAKRIADNYQIFIRNRRN
ncbi:MAG: ribosomal protein L7/L12 [Lachnospiraceae bacterium]|nr:ribosomal protein L7/L12 [Lachnospiraceae bacterium]